MPTSKSKDTKILNQLLDSINKASTEHSIMTTPGNRNVHFHEIEVALYPVQVGDNPTADGVPISLGWVVDEKHSFSLDDYESSKPEPRSRAELLMPAQVRRDMLENLGFTAREMLNTVQELKKIKRSRQKSIKGQKWDKLHLVVEKSRRKMKNIRGSVLSNNESSPSQSDESRLLDEELLRDPELTNNPLDHSGHKSVSIDQMLLMAGGDSDSEDEDKDETKSSSTSTDDNERNL
jgi:hypothetical protein